MHLLKSFFTQAGFSDSKTDQIASNYSGKKLKKEEYFAKEGKTIKHRCFYRKRILSVLEQPGWRRKNDFLHWRQ